MVISAVIQGSLIGVGVAANGTTIALGNKGDGVRSFATATTIGGTSAGQGNVISANGGNGISILPTTIPGSTALVEGNIIGLDVNGTNPLGNSGNGVLSGALNTTIGGTNTGGSTSSPATPATGSRCSTPPWARARSCRATTSAST